MRRHNEPDLRTQKERPMPSPFIGLTARTEFGEVPNYLLLSRINPSGATKISFASTIDFASGF
jgi:hypothetical protein